jgi:Uma2 family endonuclease
MGTTTTRMTVEEFLNLPEVEGERLELIDGEVKSTPLSGQPHEVTKSNLIMLLAPWATLNPGLRVFCEAAFQVNDANCLIPDISLISSNRIVPGSRGIFQTAPEFAIEVVSSEPAARLQRKIRLYLVHGSKSVWTIYPQERMVRIEDAASGSRLFLDDQQLTDPGLPGFSIPTSAIFEGV